VILAVDDLRARGAQIAIDDVGIGYSNTQRLVTLRPEIMKLDMSLVHEVDTDPMLQAVVSACVHYASKTGSRIVAEGIERRQEHDLLVRAGVDMGQGNYLGRPARRSTEVEAVPAP
jgi:EAL domain-containing protein (putative c-di-GMP-specific phosphodiesterase class I)